MDFLKFTAWLIGDAVLAVALLWGAWNAVMPGLFGLPALSVWQAALLAATAWAVTMPSLSTLFWICNIF